MVRIQADVRAKVANAAAAVQIDLILSMPSFSVRAREEICSIPFSLMITLFIDTSLSDRAPHGNTSRCIVPVYL